MGPALPWPRHAEHDCFGMAGVNHCRSQNPSGCAPASSPSATGPSRSSQQQLRKPSQRPSKREIARTRWESEGAGEKMEAKKLESGFWPSFASCCCRRDWAFNCPCPACLWMGAGASQAEPRPVRGQHRPASSAWGRSKRFGAAAASTRRGPRKRSKTSTNSKLPPRHQPPPSELGPPPPPLTTRQR